MTKKLTFTRDSRGVYCASVRSGTYQIAGPGSDMAKFLGGYSHWCLNMPDGRYAIFDSKRDAVAYAERHSNGQLTEAELALSAKTFG
jgi:hypothetical protein